LKSIPFDSLPSYSELYLTYISDFEKLRSFYACNFRNENEILELVRRKESQYLSGAEFTRDLLCEILSEQNKAFNSGENTFANIALLNQQNTFAIVTGQQLGILSGPYYTLLKALNAIQLAELYNNKFKDYKFVPVFWLESDDHDFPEINNINIISKENELKNVRYLPGGEESEKYLKPAGSIVFDRFIDDFISEIESSLHKSDFTDILFSQIKNSYTVGKSITEAFAGFMNFLIGDKGLIFINPSGAKIKNLLKPVFRRELGTSPQLCEEVINTSVELEKQFSLQVKPKPINLFYIHEGNRYLLEPRDNGIFALKHSRQKFSADELFGLLESNPERFSWNVVTRPVCEDYVLPTVAYVAGPSEISYFGQFGKVYEFFGVPMPVIYPRTSVTIIESKIKNFMEKNRISFQELFTGKNLSLKLISNLSEVSAEQIFSDLKDELIALFYTYEKELSRIDLNQTESFSKRNKQFVESLQVAKEKFTNAQIRQNEVISNQLAKTLMNVFPSNTLQERVLNILYFLNKYGHDFVNYLFEEIKIDCFEHQLISTPQTQQQ